MMQMILWVVMRTLLLSPLIGLKSIFSIYSLFSKVRIMILYFFENYPLAGNSWILSLWRRVVSVSPGCMLNYTYCCFSVNTPSTAGVFHLSYDVPVHQLMLGSLFCFTIIPKPLSFSTRHTLIWCYLSVYLLVLILYANVPKGRLIFLIAPWHMVHHNAAILGSGS